MAILFYDHLISRSQIDDLFDKIEAADNQKSRALQTIDDIIFQGLLSLILDRLPETHHRTFLTIIQERPYDPEILIYLKSHAGEDIEDNIRSEAERIIKNVLEDLLHS